MKDKLIILVLVVIVLLTGGVIMERSRIEAYSHEQTYNPYQNYSRYYFYLEKATYYQQLAKSDIGLGDELQKYAYHQNLALEYLIKAEYEFARITGA